MPTNNRWIFRTPQPLTPEMCAEIDRLGLDRQWFQWVADEEGLEFCKFALSERGKEARLFDSWHPRLLDFVAAKRARAPLPTDDSLSSLEKVTLRILAPKIASAERVPCRGNFTAAIFSAPLHVLPLVMSSWPATYRHPVFLTPAELKEWHQSYAAEEPDQERWWFVFQHWNAQPNPTPADYSWFHDERVEVHDDLTPVLVSWGLSWGSLAAEDRFELWGVEVDGRERFLQDLGIVES